MGIEGGLTELTRQNRLARGGRWRLHTLLVSHSKGAAVALSQSYGVACDGTSGGGGGADNPHFQQPTVSPSLQP